MNNVTHKNGNADLHNHTIASDGLLTPTQLIGYAKKKGLQAVAITDHDTTDGIAEALETGQKAGIEIIPGIEINTQVASSEIHILGYFIQTNYPWLQEVLSKIRDSRKNRARRIVENLVSMYGFHIEYEEVLLQAKKGAVARPHIARVLISKGIVKDIPEAFDKYLGTECPAYVDRYRLTPKEGIDMIEKAGGVAVLAHPGLLPDQSLIQSLIEQGIKGIEAFHSKHTQDTAVYYSNLALKHGLIVTGGSDCHGELFNGLPIIGDVTVGMDVVEALRALSIENKEYE
ncbi:MAG: PHP domain-containing protein [Firmicutes bacterium]|nr:PHP domain-containing protein [Bacillota bacterium]